MTNVILDETTKIALNSLSVKEACGNPSKAYRAEVMAYGIAALIQVYVMQKAKEISQQKISCNDFIQKYGLNFNAAGVDCFCTTSLKRIEGISSIFIPWQAYMNYRSDEIRPDRRITFFDSDYLSHVTTTEINGYYTHPLLEHQWKEFDLEDLQLIEEGIKFG